MPVLIRYIIVRLLLGAAIGCLSGIALLVIAPQALGSPRRWLEIGLILYGFASIFALGYLATALAGESDI